MEKSLQELKDEALSLGLDIKGLKSKADVSKLIEAHFDKASAGDIIKEAPEQEVESGEKKELSLRETMNLLAKKQKMDAMKTRVVTLTNNDKRDNYVTTTAYLSCENQYFGISKIVPLNTKVELEQCLIDIAKDVKVILHIEEVKNGKPTGNKTPQYINKYVVSYEE